MVLGPKGYIRIISDTTVMTITVERALIRAGP
jgi:hypothetical protein